MNETETQTDAAPETRDFIRERIRSDLADGTTDQLVTRFPPEPNGYLHIGHAKSICLNFGVASEFKGLCRLRFDDTNPAKEEQEFIDAIEEDVRWMGFEWDGAPRHASDYFDQLYDWAVYLIENGKAYVDDLNAEEIRAYRGTLTEPGKDSPYRGRSVEENLDLFTRGFLLKGVQSDEISILGTKLLIKLVGSIGYLFHKEVFFNTSYDTTNLFDSLKVFIGLTLHLIG